MSRLRTPEPEPRAELIRFGAPGAGENTIYSYNHILALPSRTPAETHRPLSPTLVCCIGLGSALHKRCSWTCTFYDTHPCCPQSQVSDGTAHSQAPGKIEGIVLEMTSSLHDSVQQKNAFRALVRLGFNHQSNQAIALEAGALEAIVAALTVSTHLALQVS